MKKLSTKTAEHNRPACNGTGFPVVMQPLQPGAQNLSGPVQGLRW